MELKEFIEKVKVAERMSVEERHAIEEASYNADSVETKMIICVEELAEMQKAICKWLRCSESGESTEEVSYAILEEIADVLITMDYVLNIIGFGDQDIALNAIAVKLQREKERLDNL